MKFLRTSWDVLKQTTLNFFQDDSFSDASSIAFYTHIFTASHSYHFTFRRRYGL